MAVPLRPQQNFTVVRQIANHLDEAAYYVRAVIRNSYTDEILAMLDLDAKGAQRYTKNWRVPADVSGQGFYVSIITSVYTDADHTTKSENYGDEENTHLVSNVFASAARGGSATVRGNGGLDAYTVRRIVQEEIAKIPKPDIPDFPAIPEPEMRWGEVLEALQSVKTAVSGVPTQQPDSAPILAAIQAVRDAVEAKETTPATDLAPVLDRLDEIAPDIHDRVQELADTHSQNQRVLTDELIEQMRKLLAGSNFQITMMAANMNVPKPKEEKKEEKEPQRPPIRLSDLAR